MNTVRSGLVAGSVALFTLGTITDPSSGIFAPSSCVSPAVLIALTALPTDAIGNIAQDRFAAGSGREK